MLAIITTLAGLANILEQCTHYPQFCCKSGKGKLNISVPHRRRKRPITQTTKIIIVIFAIKVSTVHKLNSGHSLFRSQREKLCFQFMQ